MRARIGVGFFILGVVLLTVDPLAGQPGGGKFGKGGFGNFGQPGATPGAPGAIPTQPGAFPMQPGGFGQPGGTRFQFQPGSGFGQPGAVPMQPGSFQYQPGGGGFGQPGGGGFGRGGGGRDPEQMFNFFSKGANAIDMGQMPPEQKMFVKGALEKMGLPPVADNAVITKDQFVAAYTQAQAAKAAAQGQQPGGFGQPGGGMTMQFGGGRPPGGGMSDEDAIRRFREADKDQDGRLSWDEASSKSRDNWAEIDVNRNQFIELDEYREYIARRYGPGAQQGGFPQQPGGFPQQPGYDFRGTGEGGGFGPGGFGGRGEKKAEDFSNVGIRYGKLPPGLPDWFAEYDTDKDGQVNMYEWRTVGGKTVAEFRELDANGDGLIAPQELIRLTATKAETERLLAIQDGEIPQGTGQGRGGKGGSMSGGGPGAFMGKGGFGPPGGGGGPPMMGKGSGGESRQPEARPGREEKGEKPDRGKNNPFANGGRKGN